MPKILTIFDREQEFKSEGFYVFDKKARVMMCKHCNSRIDWLRRDTCKKHVENETHKRKKNNSLAQQQKQISIQESLQLGNKARTEKQQFALDFTNALVQANIPLEKANDPNLKSFLNKYIEGAGDLPCAKTLRTTYVPKIGEERQQMIKDAVKDNPVIIMCDETTDRKGRCMFVILLRVLLCKEESSVYVGGVKELENATGAECSWAILNVVNMFEIKYENIVSVTTDSARYMTTCVDALKVIFSEHLVHVQCWAHKLNLVASLWSAELSVLNTCVQKTKSAFQNTRKRKHRYISFLKLKYVNGEKKPVLFPAPVMTRWSSWFNSTQYIAEYLEDLVEYLKDVEEGGSAIEYFRKLAADEIAAIKCSATFLTDHCKPVIDTIAVLEGAKYPFAHKVSSRLSDFQDGFLIVNNGDFSENTQRELRTIRSQIKHSAMVQSLKTVGMKSHTKLARLIAEDSAKMFVSSIGTLFDVRNIATNVVDQNLHAIAKKVPLLKEVTQPTFLQGYMAFQRKVAAVTTTNVKVDVIQILLSLQEDHAHFVQQSVRAIWIPPSNVDSERAFSSYGHVLTDLRTNLKAENLEIMLVSYFGNKA